MKFPNTIFLTGVAGFIGYHVARRLLDNDIPVVGIDNLNPYYNPKLKEARLKELSEHPNHHKFNFYKAGYQSITFWLMPPNKNQLSAKR